MSDSNNGNFVMVPRDLYQSGISPRALLVWICLRDNAEGYNLGIRKIAERTHLNARTVIKAIAELTELNVVKVTNSGYRNEYQISNMVPKVQRVDTKSAASLYQKCSELVPKVQHNKNNNKNNEKKRDKNNPTPASEPAKSTPKPKKEKPAKKTEPKYTQSDMSFSSDWIDWLRERGSHHAKTANKQSYATSIAKLREKYGLTHARLPDMKQIVTEDEFWASNLISPNGLLKKWKNGNVACLSLLDALDKVHKTKPESIGLFDDEIAEIKRMEKLRDEANMQNVTPIRPKLIGGIYD